MDIWKFPKWMGVPNHPKFDHDWKLLKAMVLGYRHFGKPPYTDGLVYKNCVWKVMVPRFMEKLLVWPCIHTCFWFIMYTLYCIYTYIYMWYMECSFQGLCSSNPCMIYTTGGIPRLGVSDGSYQRTKWNVQVDHSSCLISCPTHFQNWMRS
jgi:hypothetical protein